MGTATSMLGVAPSFLRALGTHGLLGHSRSDGGHRRYSRADLILAARAREVVDEGLPLAAACRIVELEHQLAAAHDTIARLQQRLDAKKDPCPGPTTGSTDTARKQ